MNNIRRSIPRVRACLVLVVLGWGCTDSDENPLLPPDGEAAEEPTGGIYGLVALRSQGSALQVVTIRIAGGGEGVASYQGGLRFDPEVLTLEEVRTPGWGHHFVNDAEAAEGRLRFAGFAVESFEGPVDLLLMFRAKRRLRAQDLELELDVLGTERGIQVPEEAVTVVQGLVNAERLR
ncbi:MAG TPA: hypothetical protein VGA70_10135 [Longimicrobiales bacterium]